MLCTPADRAHGLASVPVTARSGETPWCSADMSGCCAGSLGRGFWHEVSGSSRFWQGVGRSFVAARARAPRRGRSPAGRGSLSARAPDRRRRRPPFHPAWHARHRRSAGRRLVHGASDRPLRARGHRRLAVDALATSPVEERKALEALRREAHPLTGDHRDYDRLMALIGDARIVLLGEASHGTHEFYRERARITKRLIAEEGFTAVAIEGDWPDAYRANRYVSGARDDPDAEAALRGFRRFPTWM